jgi:starch synthase
MPALRVLSVASEVHPIVKTGGLADVVGALPRALAQNGVDVATLVPGYSAVIDALPAFTSVAKFDDLFGGEARLLAGTAAGIALLVVDAPHLFRRKGGPYAGPDGTDWPDNAFRFAALGRMAAEIARGRIKRFVPDAVHAHDWQAGLLPAYLQADAQRPPVIFTVHNLAFQGKYPRELLTELGLPADSFTADGVEYYGTIGYLKAGLQYADRITTVSPTYAAEILTTEWGMGLEGLLRKRASVLSGILNGIDDEIWDPATDPDLTANYDARDATPRAANTSALRSRFGLEDDPTALLVGVVSRLSWQKGLDVLLEALPRLVGAGAQLVLLGSGDAGLERGFVSAARANPSRVGCVIGYDESLAHQIQGGAHAVLVPSRFEPCGLTQLCALRYGAVPIVSRVGGLADTVIDANEAALAAGSATGIQFAPVTREALEFAIARAVKLFGDRNEWERVQANGMKSDVSWRRPAGQYAQLYRAAIRERSRAR